MTRVSTAANVSSFNTDAKFRTWGGAVSAAFAACGLVKTADTGQVNWNTVTKPVAANTTAGYEMWRFNDALQAGAPIYLRFNYGSGAVATGNSPHMSFQVGTGSNGAGTLTGIQSGTYAGGSDQNNNNVSVNTSATMLFTHTAGFLLAYAESNNTGNHGGSPFFFAVERTRDQVTGAATAEGMYVWRGVYNAQASLKGQGQAFSFFAAAFPDAPTACMPPGDAASYGGYIFPVYACIPRPLVCASLVGYMDAEIANYSTFTAKPMGVAGSTVTYIALSICGSSSLYGVDVVAGVANEASVRTAFRWED